jgi:hypothetical protein
LKKRKNGIGKTGHKKAAYYGNAANHVLFPGEMTLQICTKKWYKVALSAFLFTKKSPNLFHAVCTPPCCVITNGFPPKQKLLVIYAYKKTPFLKEMELLY